MTFPTKLPDTAFLSAEEYPISIPINQVVASKPAMIAVIQNFMDVFIFHYSLVLQRVAFITVRCGTWHD